jgi:hypothetical protein
MACGKSRGVSFGGLGDLHQKPTSVVNAEHGIKDGIPTGTFTVFSGCAGLLIGFANTLLEDEIPGQGR